MAEKTRIIEIMSYNPEWKMEFKKIKIMIESYIGDLILRIEHVGSTSVEGLEQQNQLLIFYGIIYQLMRLCGKNMKN